MPIPSELVIGTLGTLISQPLIVYACALSLMLSKQKKSHDIPDNDTKMTCKSLFI